MDELKELLENILEELREINEKLDDVADKEAVADISTKLDDVSGNESISDINTRLDALLFRLG